MGPWDPWVNTPTKTAPAAIQVALQRIPQKGRRYAIQEPMRAVGGLQRADRVAVHVFVDLGELDV